MAPFPGHRAVIREECVLALLSPLGARGDIKVRGASDCIVPAKVRRSMKEVAPMEDKKFNPDQIERTLMIAKYPNTDRQNPDEGFNHTGRFFGRSSF